MYVRHSKHLSGHMYVHRQTAKIALILKKMPKHAAPKGRRPGCRKSGLRHFFEVFIAPLRLRRGQGAMQGNPCYARLFADLTHMSPNPIKASGGCGPQWSLRVAAKAASFKALAHRASAWLPGRALGAREPWKFRKSGESHFFRQAAIARGVFLRAQKSPGKLTRAWDLVHPQGLEPWTP